MALEYLDLENKLYVPTTQLFGQLQVDLTAIYESSRNNLIQIHREIALLGREFYDAPLETLAIWYDQAVSYGTGLYADWLDNVLPRVEERYREMTDASADFVATARDNIHFMIENPQQVTAEAIQWITDNVTMASTASLELIAQLQDKTTEIVALLSEQPLQTLDAGVKQVLAGLLESYFEMVTSLLAVL